MSYQEILKSESDRINAKLTAAVIAGHTEEAKALLKTIERLHCS